MESPIEFNNNPSNTRTERSVLDGNNDEALGTDTISATEEVTAAAAAAPTTPPILDISESNDVALGNDTVSATGEVTAAATATVATTITPIPDISANESDAPESETGSATGVVAIVAPTISPMPEISVNADDAPESETESATGAGGAELELESESESVVKRRARHISPDISENNYNEDQAYEDVVEQRPTSPKIAAVGGGENSSLTDKITSQAEKQDFSPLLLVAIDNEALRHIVTKILAGIFIAAAVLVITALVLNVNALPLAIAGVVAGLIPLAFNAILGTSIAVAAVATVTFGASCASSFFHKPNSGGGFNVVNSVNGSNTAATDISASASASASAST